ncbi:glycosyl hydrolase family 28-related protein [Streptomyces sp. DH8]|uniref:glycosyl hydrolase family 28-related protein n=1 Tax=Streptomyces sp. DH8 TaxID=2857008 RepID=UPI0027D2BF7C|nr:glycosyl hydrolase family 28-related protein [Streptomyces sp. DH8]
MSKSADISRRRAMFAGAATGLASVALGTSASPAAAAEGDTPLDWFNVKDYGAAGNNAGDDTAAIQAAIDAAAAEGGTVYFPTGRYIVKPTATGPALTITGDGVRLVGAGSKAATLVKGAPGLVLRIAGIRTGSKGEKHRRYCSIQDLGFDGNGRTGVLLELYYANNCYFRDVFMTSNHDICIDAVEFWDSRFYNLVIEKSTGPADSKAHPNIWLRNASATSGWGYSEDNNNQIHFTGCRLEGFGTGALWITEGVVKGQNPNGIYITDCKFESSYMQGGPHIKVDASCKHIHARNIYAFAGKFAQDYTPKAQTIINWAPRASSLQDVLIANGSVATISSGVELYSGPGSTAVLSNVVGLYGTAPTGAHIWYATSTGDFRVENSYGDVGVQAQGSIPAKNQPNPPLRLIAGPVSDASFTRPPADGTLAVDTTNKRLYVRLGGTWSWSPLNT